jgi:hypothetical protein
MAHFENRQGSADEGQGKLTGPNRTDSMNTPAIMLHLAIEPWSMAILATPVSHCGKA